MKRIDLRMNELEKYMTIKKLVEQDGNKRRCAIKLNCSIRTIQRLIKVYKEKGKEGFVHKNRDKKPLNFIPNTTRTFIVKLFNDLNKGNLVCSVAHLKDILNEKYSITISTTSLHNILKEHDLISKCATRKSKKELKKRLNEKLNKENLKLSIKKQIVDKIIELDRMETHPTRPRAKYAGELIQMDASSHEWFNGITTNLHVAIDDSTKAIVGAYFDTQETLNGYYQVFRQIMQNYGIPAKFLTDKRTVFEYKKKDSSIEKEFATNFSYACSKLGTEIETTSVAEAKGRVERLNRTLQLRIPIDFKLKGIKTIEEANKYILPYLKKLCKRFNYDINLSKSVFDEKISDEEINIYLSRVTERQINRGNIIQFNNRKYFPLNSNGERVYIKPKTKVLVIETLNKELLFSIGDILYNSDEINEKELISKKFDFAENVEKTKKKHIPSLNHPWKQQSYMAYLHKKELRENRL